jgi:hypothetical protein
MVKMTTPDLMSRSLAALSGSGTMTSTLWIVGYPGETAAEFDETLRFIREHRAQIYQADAWLFQFHREGLAASGEISRTRGARPRFSPEFTRLLSVSPCVIADDMPMEERYNRLERFVAMARELSIPNPYSVFEWAGAERRWMSLGHNARRSVKRNRLALNS